MAECLVGLHRAVLRSTVGPLLNPDGHLTTTELVTEQLQVLLLGEDPPLLLLPDLRINPDYGYVILLNFVKIRLRETAHVFNGGQQ